MTRAFGCGLVAASVLLVACGRAAGPEDVALEYGRAIYASDAEAAWRLSSPSAAAWRRDPAEENGKNASLRRSPKPFMNIAKYTGAPRI